MNLIATAVFLLCTFQLSVQDLNSLNNAIQQLEQKLSTLIKRAQQNLTPRNCTGLLNCGQTSYNDCEGVGIRACHQTFQTPNYCLNKGSFLSIDSSFRTPYNMPVERLNEDEKHFICSTAQKMEGFFKDLNNGRDQKYGIAYISSITGVHRRYPSKTADQDQTGNCKFYDPRQRPWFKTAIINYKNIIILVDISRSMNDYLQTLKTHLSTVVKRLSYRDNLQIILFSRNARKLFDTFQNVSDSLVNNITKIIQSIVTQQSNVNYTAAFESAFQTLDQPNQLPTDSPNIFFLISSLNQKADTNATSVINFISQKKGNRKINIVTYHFRKQQQSNVSEAQLFLIQLSCSFRGISFNLNLENGKSGINSLDFFFKFIHVGVKRHAQWAGPYQDSFGYGDLLTIAQPIIYTKQNGVNSLIGVGAIDVVLDTILSHGQTLQKVLNIIHERNLANKNSSQKSLLNLNECQIQQMRPQKYRCILYQFAQKQEQFSSLAQCKIQNSDLACILNSSSLLATPISKQNHFCCGLTTAAFVGIICGSLCGSLLCITISILAFMKMRQKWFDYYQEENQQVDQHSQKRVQPNRNNNLQGIRARQIANIGVDSSKKQKRDIKKDSQTLKKHDIQQLFQNYFKKNIRKTQLSHRSKIFGLKCMPNAQQQQNSIVEQISQSSIQIKVQDSLDHYNSQSAHNIHKPAQFEQ